ncbi:hypothetical protein D3C73_1581550 [compost metagenome]
MQVVVYWAKRTDVDCAGSCRLTVTLSNGIGGVWIPWNMLVDLVEQGLFIDRFGDISIHAM